MRRRRRNILLAADTSDAPIDDGLSYYEATDRVRLAALRVLDLRRSEERTDVLVRKAADLYGSMGFLANF